MPTVGSPQHLAAELLIGTTGIKGVPVQFGGDAPSYIEPLAGRVDATTTALPPHIKTGVLRMLGRFSDNRSSVSSKGHANRGVEVVPVG